MLSNTMLYSLLAFAGVAVSAKSCRCLPSDSCWPSQAEWQSLNQTANGHVHALRPLAAVCHGSGYNYTACNIAKRNENDELWRSNQPGAVDWPNWEAWPAQNQSCYIDSKKTMPCGQGRISRYTLQAESVEDIQAGVRFASMYNLRVAIKNTGHNHAGRSVAPESLQINTHLMTNMTKHTNFKPAGYDGEDGGVGLAATLGAGVQLYDMYRWLGENDIIAVGGSAAGVGVTGGYIQGGGHSLLAGIHGMASDNALEFNVVVANGSHLTANAYQNADLFWALRGGGGGTWGVVTSVTVRAFEDKPIVSFSISGGAQFQSEEYWKAVEYFHAFLPEFNEAGGSMYYWLIPDYPDSTAGQISAITAEGGFGNATSKAAVDKIMQPFIYALGNMTGSAFNYTSTYVPKATSMYIELTESTSGVGSPVILGSRLVTRDFMKSAEGPGKVTEALRSLRVYPGNTTVGENAIQGLVVAGPAVWANAGVVNSALHPIWRQAQVHLIIARGWDTDTSFAEQQKIHRNLTEVEVPILKKLDPAPEGGCYLNEADGYEEDFQDSFWGSNYPLLYDVKQKWDPENLFIVRTGVGSEDWDAEALCPV
ncbi:hypothetical protein N7520_008801 [Penicillium odoratum]|uniref:uncharacterized protein n=1 Tax=Penicillium odoratum TaxID=1167516 RepID=UPI002547DE82|nr:uncharacterized protein N7520_008801 [Penicillium odoratum]KAJ5751884.1 hypothetical protein N7520_008801 [Penicillium odoratum]